MGWLAPPDDCAEGKEKAAQWRPSLFHSPFFVFGGWAYSEMSTSRASRAFLRTEAMPLSTLLIALYISRLPMISPLAALSTKYCSPFLASLFSKRFSVAVFFRTDSIPFSAAFFAS